VATPATGYRFVNWTVDVATIANVNAASTAIIINGSYSITANFALVFPIVEIWNWHDLDAVRDNLGGYYLLMNDLDSTTAGYAELASPTANQGKGWEPIGTWAGRFTGVFHGQGYEIEDLFILRPDEGHVGVGFFGDVGPGGVIEHVGVANVVVTGEWDVGGLVALNWFGGLVSNSYSSGSVTGEQEVGGLVGLNHAIVSNSFWDVETSGLEESDGGTGKTTAEMQDIATFSGVTWHITAVAPGVTNPAYTWNIVDDVTYPFLSWQSVS